MDHSSPRTNPEKLNALVLGVGGNVSQSIQKALALSGVATRVVAACIAADAAGLYLADKAYISPLARDAEFVPWLCEICERERIDVVLSGSEPVLAALAPIARSVREQTGAVSIVSAPEVIRIGSDKLLTCRWLERNGLPVPGCAELADRDAVGQLVRRCGFPLVAKPRFGKGAGGILVVHDEHELEAIGTAAKMVLAQDMEMVLQQHLGTAGDEFTAGCFCDRDGALRGTIVMRRRLQHGTTVTAEAGEFPEVRAAAEAIVTALRPLGPCNVQLREHQGRPVPFEVNPRFSGTTALRARMGFNEVDAALRHFVLDEPVPKLQSSASAVALRYWNEVYAPLDALDGLRHGDATFDRGSIKVEVEDWGSSA